MGLQPDEVARSVRGSWRLMTQGGAALAEFDQTPVGLRHSFAALLLALPALVAILAAERRLLGEPGDLFDRPLLVAAVVAAEALSILAVPALLAALAPGLLREGRFVSFLIAWNWAGILGVSLMAVPAAVYAIGWSNPGIATIQTLAFASIVLRLRFCVARAALGGGVVPALVTTASLLADYAAIRAFGLGGF